MAAAFKLCETNLDFYPRSLTAWDGLEYGLENSPHGPRLAVLGGPDSPQLQDFKGDHSAHDNQTLLLCPLTAENASALRLHLPWLQPHPLGLNTSAGLGDRLGLATPGHVRAVRSVGGNIQPIFAQQSMREMARSGRTPQQVMDDATWGTFQEGWQEGVGADADHLKTENDIDLCLSAGFTFFTIDPGDLVDTRAESASPELLRELADQLTHEIQPDTSGLAGQTIDIEHLAINFNETLLHKAAVKYGRAVARAAVLYRHLAQTAGSRAFELEISVDETEQPTTHAEHIYIASELKRLGVKWVSLAPRYPGRFEKGVDYIGDLEQFKAELAGHAAIARHYGPYKLSLHSGSDKFSIYPAARQFTRGLVHLKTAGTSYLEALRTIAAADQDLFREIYIFSREKYSADRASYHVSGDLTRAPQPGAVQDWPELLDHFDARQILHVTFGSVLSEKNASGQSRFSGRLFAVLTANREAYWENLQIHFERHLSPFLNWEES
jgi:hypothetical protein